MKTEDKIHKQLAENPIILYMKGIPANPQCGFSGKTVGILDATKVPYAYVNVLEAPFIREKLPSISHWPTFPQLFVNGELVGGCDIVEEMANNGSLLPLLTAAMPKKAESTEGLSTTEVAQLVQQGIPDAQVIVDGAGCDLLISVVSEQFGDLSIVKKQQLVLATLKEPLASGKLHAVSVKAYTPEEWQSLQSAKKDPGLLQIQH
ncbi:MAG: Grx4 family monothiol glutaredoxin [Methylococcaceae bacterium]|nr:Grx4 family monothiol glutaredoxin [Methylococcaceae bacterium]MDZ4156337.1 Grx4 family monothiol glutaredoxin [Methylococcales bacterium]MDP2394598.1 Grx4 family monothiol glutaredoxin [Methylococcaceae bacterium]MDP3019066.1 Grx4 family monothiol glutaredoxin [Methylococcaceae bacterium]MDP3390282.1 Grx4 family monothiol glutaredoxin [Methylococcaceae bacterium]